MKYCVYCLKSRLSSLKQKKTKMIKLPSFHFRNWWLNKAVKFYSCSILYKNYLILQNILNFISYVSNLFFFIFPWIYKVIKWLSPFFSSGNIESPLTLPFSTYYNKHSCSGIFSQPPICFFSNLAVPYYAACFFAHT